MEIPVRDPPPRERLPDYRLVMLRIQLFTAMQVLEEEDLAEFWELIEEVRQAGGRSG